MKFESVNHIESIAIVGGTGLVGREFLDLLTENKIHIPKIKILASGDSAGEQVEIPNGEATVEELRADSFDDIEVAFFSVPNDVTKQFVPHAVEAGCLVFDDSNCYRMDKDVPLVVPQVNGSLLRDFEGKIVSTPNCTTTPLALCLKPLNEKYAIRRVVVSTYQSVSGAGKEAFNELSGQTAALLNGGEAEISIFPHRIAFNCLPWIGSVAENGNSEEEEKIGRELRKILQLPSLKVSATAVRVPTFCGHGLSVNVEFDDEFESIEEIRELMAAFPGLKVLDNPSSHIYPTNIEAIGSNHTFVGRIRRDNSIDSGINFWVVADNLRKGAALNVLESLETLYNYRRMS